MAVPESRTAAAADSVSVEVASPTQRRMAFASAFLGSTIEFYDFIIYSTAATLVFASVFFKGMPTSVGIIASFGTLAVGYFARPIGGVLFGHWGDRFSRKNSLIATLIIMGLATSLIGLLPTPAQVGVWAPVLLVVLRVVQGVAVGGEWAGSVLLSVESARPDRRGVISAATPMGTSAGFLLGVGAFALVAGLDKESFLSWGWRIPFLASLVLLGLGLWMRLKLEDSPVEKLARAAGDVVSVPVAELFRSHWKRTLLAVGIYLGPFTIYSVTSTFAVTFATTFAGVSRQSMLTLQLITPVVNLALIPLYGRLSDRVGRRKVYIPATAGMLITAFGFFPAIQTGNVSLIASIYVFHNSLLFGAVVATVGALYAELFPTKVRFTGTAVAYQGAAMIGGAFGPLLTSVIGADGRGVFSMGLLLAATIVISLVCLVFLRETKDNDLVSV